MYFQTIVLTCHQQMQKERSISATYYLLQGKPSIQTIQDGQIYRLNKYFGIYKDLDKDRFFQIVEKLLDKQFITKNAKDNFYLVTELGKRFIDQYPFQPNYLEGSLYKNIDIIFYQRLLLFIQVFTNRKMNHSKYVPIIENKDVETWMKAYYKKTKNKVDIVLKTLYEEIVQILSPLEEIYSEVFVNQLTGYRQIGLTIEQIAHQLQMSVETTYLIHVNTIHYLLNKIQMEQTIYPLLYSISADLFQQSSLTNSTKVTRKLLDAGHSLTEIAQKRRLQINTIYDHLVEIALNDPNFSISKYVPKEAQQEIVQAIEQLHSYKLKDIKQAVRDDISYFQIRLVIAKLDELL